MNIWKLTSISLAVALVASIGIQTAWAGVCHDQPNMAHAAELLHQARAALDKAEHNKGDWRVKAIEATNKAIAETDRGCAFADTH
jgi:hypothetical protein